MTARRRFILIVLAVLVLLPLLGFLLQRAVTPGVAHAGSYRACGTWSATLKQTGHVLGIDTGKTLFGAQMYEYACANRRYIVTYQIEPTVNGGVTGFGSVFGWSYAGVQGGSGPKLDKETHTGLTTKRVVKFERCLPLPTGCLPNGSASYRLKLTIFANGGHPYAWANWKRV